MMDAAQETARANAQPWAVRKRNGAPKKLVFQNTLPCKENGCTRRRSIRGMCERHYDTWLKRMQRRGVKFGTATVADGIKKPGILPGTYQQVAARLEMSYEGVQRAMKILHEKGEVHISNRLPPDLTLERGSKWVAVFSLGPGVDYEVPDDVRQAFVIAAGKERRRRWRVKHRPTKAQQQQQQQQQAVSFADLMAPLLKK